MTHSQEIHVLLVKCVQEQMTHCMQLLTLLQNVRKKEELAGVISERVRVLLETSVFVNGGEIIDGGGSEILVEILKTYPRSKRIVSNVSRILSILFPLEE